LYASERMSPDFDHDHIYGLMAGDLLPKIAPGLVGLFIASLLAGVMSSCDAFMVACSALFTENVYRKLIVRDAPDRHYMTVGRLVSILVVIVAILFAYSLDNVVKGLEVFWKISAMMGLAFWMGLFWRRTTAAAAWAGTLVCFALYVFTGKISIGKQVLWDFNAQLADKLPGFMLWEGKLYLPWQMIFYLGAGLLTIIVVSLLTRRTSADRLERFYGCLRTPVQPGEPETEPFTLPDGVEPAPRRVWFDHFELEIPRITWIGFVGVFLTAVAVAALIAGVYWIFSLGA